MSERFDVERVKRMINEDAYLNAKYYQHKETWSGERLYFELFSRYIKPYPKVMENYAR